MPKRFRTDGVTPELVEDKYRTLVTRLSEELEYMIKMAAFQRKALENELFTGMGYKQLGVSEKDLKKMKVMTEIMDQVVATKVRFDKAQKLLSENLTPAEERAAVMAFIKAQTPTDRWNILLQIKRWQDGTPEEIKEEDLYDAIERDGEEAPPQ
jgi:hypothetical protein